MHTFLDIESIPGQTSFETFLKDAKENFKAPSDLTKGQACEDLGLTGDAAKYTSKDDAIKLWTERFGKEIAPERDITPTRQEPKALEFYPAEDFAKNFSVWEKAIESGKRTPDQIIAMVESKAALTNEQKFELISLGV